MLSNNQSFLEREKKFGIVRKWAVYLLGIILLWLLEPREINNSKLVFFLVIELFYAFYSLWVVKGGSRSMLLIPVRLSYLVELGVVGLLVFSSGGLDSLLFILYPLTLISVAMVEKSMVAFTLFGIFTYLSLIATLLVYYSSLWFFLDFYFWVLSLVAGFAFLAGVMLSRYIISNEPADSESKNLFSFKG